MKKTQSIGLLGAGNLTRSSVNRLPEFADRLGPVKASSFRIASRIANSLRAGHAVESAAAFESCGLVLVCVPDLRLPAAISELERALPDWKHRTIALCDSRHDSTALGRLAERGARVVSLMLVGGSLVLEGDASAIAELRRTLRLPARRVMELSPRAKPLFLAGLTFAARTTYLAAAANDCLRASGVHSSQSRPLVRHLMNDAVHAYAKAGHKATERKSDREQLRSARREVAALRALRPELAAFFTLLLNASVRLSGATLPAKIAP